MTAILPVASQTKPFYPSADGEPVAETFDHLYALLTTIEVLKLYLKDRDCTVLGNQFLYYAQNRPKSRLAPDVMVIFDVAPGGRDNYKIWEEGQVPQVIFEMTSKGTKKQDQVTKKRRYRRIGVKEYWLFDPKGEWLRPQLYGYRLQGKKYKPIEDGCSEPLQLRLQVEGKLIGFYRLDTGEKLLISSELESALQKETIKRLEAEAVAKQERQRASEQSRLAELERQRASEQARLADLERQRASEQARLADLERQRASEQSRLADFERQRAQEQSQRALQAESRNEQLLARLRELGIDPDQ